jgi:uncharacterized spore protein YtfJ
MDADELLRTAKDNLSVRRVFGDPIESAGVVVVPVAVVAGGGGGGSMEASESNPRQSGGGFGTWTRPIGVYEIRDGRVRFLPAVDLVPLAIVGALVLRMLVRRLGRD